MISPRKFFSNDRIRAALAAFAIGLLFPLAGCRVVRTTVELPGKAVSTVTKGESKRPEIDAVEAQQYVLRLSDQLFTRVVIGVDELRRGTNALDDAEVLKWKIAFGTETTSMASGPNAIANLLDMTVFVTVTGAALEEYWEPQVFGESARELIEGFRNTETNLWQYVGRTLKPEQQTELREAIAEWRQRNLSPKAVLSARAVGFASRVAEANRDAAGKSGSVFNLLMLDPLAGLDPAARELAQTRLFAERALYVSQKMPLLLRWQTELLALNSVHMPEVQQLITNATQLADAVETVSRVANQIPELLDRQREAAIRQMFEGVASERTNLIASLAESETKLRETLKELNSTLDSGTEFARASDSAFKSLDAFVARFDKGTNAPSAPPATNSRPFDILDYATAAKEMTATFRELNATISSLDKAVPEIQKAGETLENTSNRLLNRLFLRAAGLIVLLGVCLCVAAAVHRSKNRTHGCQ